MIRKLTFLLSSTLVALPAFAQDPPAAPAADDNAAAAAPAAAPVVAPPTETKKKGGGPSPLGISPEAPQEGAFLVTPNDANPVEEPEPSSEWKFDVTGYTRAPLRMSWGPPTTAAPNGGNAGTQLRTPAMVPDGNYIDWKYTNSMVGPWTELNFHYGNSRAKATIQIASYNITDSGYRRLESNLGINLAFLTINFPELWSENARLTLNVGGFTNRYGAAGRYDGGKYETYLFGRTHVVGYTGTLEQDAGNDWTFALEQGFGGKIEPIPYYGAPGAATTPTGQITTIPIWDPYAGPVPQESTFVAHGHLGAVFKKKLLLGLHYINVFANDNERAGSYANTMTGYGTTTIPTRPVCGSVVGGVATAESACARPGIVIMGGDAKLLGGWIGDGYLGYSHLSATNALYLADAIEVLHSFGGVQLHDNYFHTGPANRVGNYTTPTTGTIDSVEFQYVFSFGQFFRYPQAFWGDGPDLIASVFGMFNHVSAPFNTTNPHTNKLKYGADITYLPIPWFGIGARYDLVSPEMDDTTQNFSVFSPRIIIKTAFVTHEQIIFQYSRYFYGTNAATSQYPYTNQPGGSALGADKNAAQIAAVLWF